MREKDREKADGDNSARTMRAKIRQQFQLIQIILK